MTRETVLSALISGSVCAALITPIGSCILEKKKSDLQLNLNQKLEDIKSENSRMLAKLNVDLENIAGLNVARLEAYKTLCSQIQELTNALNATATICGLIQKTSNSVFSRGHVKESAMTAGAAMVDVKKSAEGIEIDPMIKKEVMEILDELGPLLSPLTIKASFGAQEINAFLDFYDHRYNSKVKWVYAQIIDARKRSNTQD